MKQAIKFIQSEIKTATARSHEIRKQIHASKGDARCQLWQTKRWHGDGTRVLLLAYACLRGLRYELVEPKCRVGNEPSATAILRAVEASWPKDAPGCEEWTLERVRGWLARPEALQAAPAEGKVAA